MNIVDMDEYNRIRENVKRRVKRWPSAYASGMVVSEYKKAMEAKGVPAYADVKPKAKSGLARWFSEEWVDIKTGAPCGSVRSENYYPTCRPKKRVTHQTPVTVSELTADQRKSMIAQKQKALSDRVLYQETKTRSRA